MLNQRTDKRALTRRDPRERGRAGGRRGSERRERTRRDHVTYGGVLVGGGLPAGSTGADETASPPAEAVDEETLFDRGRVADIVAGEL
jgi:hypothetical protein